MTRKQTFAFALQISIVVAFLAGSAAPTPLYAIYQAAWGFTPITITIVFGIYAVAVLAALLVVGSLSDHIGRRPVLIVAALAQVAAMVVFVTADGVGALLAARIVQGLATGAAAGAVGAGLLDLDRAKGTTANAIAPMLGTGTGGLLGGLFVAYLPAPTQLVYGVLAVVFVLQAIGVYAIAETAPLGGPLDADDATDADAAGSDLTRASTASAAVFHARSGRVVGGAPGQVVDRSQRGLARAAERAVARATERARRRAALLASLRPKLSVPPAVRGPLLVAVPALVAAWALAGFYGSIGPAVLRRLVGSTSPLIGGAALGIMAFAGAILVWLLRGARAHRVIVLGTLLLAAGTAATLVAIAVANVPVFFAGVVVAGAGFGASFNGGIRSVVPLAAPTERAGVLSVVYIVAYLAMGVPVVIGGARMVATHDVFATAFEYGAGVVALALLAFAGATVPALARRRAARTHVVVA